MSIFIIVGYSQERWGWRIFHCIWYPDDDKLCLLIRQNPWCAFRSMATISDKQSAYQRLKRNLDHIFTLRLMITLAIQKTAVYWLFCYWKNFWSCVTSYTVQKATKNWTESMNVERSSAFLHNDVMHRYIWWWVFYAILNQQWNTTRGKIKRKTLHLFHWWPDQIIESELFTRRYSRLSTLTSTRWWHSHCQHVRNIVCEK